MDAAGIEGQVATLEAAKLSAVEAEDYVTASALKGAIAALRQQHQDQHHQHHQQSRAATKKSAPPGTSAIASAAVAAPANAAVPGQAVDGEPEAVKRSPFARVVRSTLQR